MFDFQPMELVVLGTVAILVIPPKDLPKAMRVAGYWVGRMRGVAQQFGATLHAAGYPGRFATCMMAGWDSPSGTA